MKEIAFSLELGALPDGIHEFLDGNGSVGPEGIRDIAAAGVISQNVYLDGNRLFMVLRVEDGFDRQADLRTYLARYLEKIPRAKDRTAPMPGEGDRWEPLERIYDLNATLREVGGDPRPLLTPGPILDTHQHFWRIDRGDYSWMSPDHGILYRDYLPDDLAPLLRQAGVTGTVLVQAADTEAETDFLLDLADRCDFVVGVCGWLDMDCDGFSARLDRYRRNPRFLAFRPMLQDLEEDDWILKPRVLGNLAYVASVGMRFEFLTRPPQLPYAVEAIKRTPGLRAVMNHMSKPFIAEGTLEPWASQIAELGAFPDIYCKISGMVTEANREKWGPEDLRPYIAHILEVFGQDRVMFGSDWPVSLLAATGYGDVLNALRTVVGPLLDIDGHRKLFHDNGTRFYGI